MPRCATCQTSYPAHVQRCPADGTLLADSLVDGNDRTTPAAAATAVAATTPAPSTDAQAIASSERDRELRPGATVGEYQVTGVIGAGGMGTVYAGVHPLIGKKVAIKVLNAGLCDDPTMVSRFVQEARAVNQIGHRNIVDIFAFGQLPSGRHYCVMELLPGRSLKDRLREGPLPYAEAFAILVEVCDALSAAHAEGIVHRDLKPDNIFLKESKSGERTVKLLDFGIAKLLHEESVASTRSGVPMGTPLYMSPEQCLGKGVDARADVYSLGVILFEMFSGQLPFPGPSFIETVNGHLSTPAPPLGERVDVPAALESLVARCLAKDAAERPPLPELKAQLSSLARQLGAAIPARHDARTVTATRASAPGGSRAGLIYAGIALGAAALAVAAVVALKPRSTAPKSAPATPPTLALQVISDQPGAEVFLDGKRQALKTPGVFTVPHAKRIVVRLEKPDYEPWTRTVELADDDSARSVDAMLTPLHAPSGRLEAKLLNAKRATWLLDGKPVGDGSGQLVLEAVPAGKHQLHVEAKGSQPRDEAVEIAPRQTHSLEWMLEPARLAAKKKSATKPAAIGDDPGAEWPPK